MNNTTITNLKKFGMREIKMANELMLAYAEGNVPKWFANDGVTVGFNPYSGNVFLTNNNHQILMFDDGELKSWYYLGYYGHEGFINDLWYGFLDGDIRPEDWKELAFFLEQEGMCQETHEVKRAIEEDEEVQHNVFRNYRQSK